MVTNIFINTFFNVTKEYVLWSSSSTQFFFNVDYPNIVALRANSNMNENLVPKFVPLLQIQNQTTTEVVEKVTIQQLFDA